MANRIAVVTGAGTGVGAAVATALATEGWLVVLAGRRPAPLLELAAARPELLLDPVPTDVTEEQSVRSLFDATIARHGRVDLLFNDGRPYDIACGQIDVGNAATDLTAATAEGVPQADGSVRAEPLMQASDVARAVVYMAGLPLDTNVATMTVMATKMPYLGRG